MLSLTHAAREHVTALLADEPVGKVVRISDSPDGIQFAVDRVRIGDKTFNSGDKCVLSIDQMVLRRITATLRSLSEERRQEIFGFPPRT